MPKWNLIVVLETEKDEKSDAVYFSYVKDTYYDMVTDNKDISIQYFYMDGKRNYKAKKLTDRIKNTRAMHRSYGNECAVAYVFDTDSVAKEYAKGSFFSNVQQYCNDHGFELIWFCKNAENVFLGKEPDSLNKTAAALEFVRNNRKIDEYKLSKKTIELGYSNILLVLDKYLKRKTNKS